VVLFVMFLSPLTYAQPRQFGTITVYTRNLYIGTAFGEVLEAPPEDLVEAARAAFDEITQTNFPRRAEALAEEIQTLRPHLIGLQEVFNFTLNGTNSGLPFVDSLATFLAALEARGLDYQVAAVVNNLALTFNFDLFPFPEGPERIQVTDRDVILARRDVATAVATFPCPQPLDDPTDDGCTYTTLLPLQLPPVLDTFVFRGFVGVDAEVQGTTVRFVNTHLEVPRAGGQDITAIQQAQAAELVGAVAMATPPKRPVILVGDFNSAPTEPAGSAYDIIRSAAYADTWRRNLLRFLNPDGFTCCQDNDLNNDVSLLDERIDIIFVKNNLGVFPVSFTGPVVSVVIGDDSISDSQPKWSSDHAGPLVVLPRLPVFEHEGSLRLAGAE
jgi:hypothetical protein